MSKLQSNVDSVSQLAEEIISGRRMGRTDDMSVLLTADIEELCSGADAIRKAFCGAKLFQSGANAAITGDMLTTTGTSIADDIEMFKQLGYEL